MVLLKNSFWSFLKYCCWGRWGRWKPQNALIGNLSLAGIRSLVKSNMVNFTQSSYVCIGPWVVFHNVRGVFDTGKKCTFTGRKKRTVLKVGNKLKPMALSSGYKACRVSRLGVNTYTGEVIREVQDVSCFWVWQQPWTWNCISELQGSPRYIIYYDRALWWLQFSKWESNPSCLYVRVLVYSHIPHIWMWCFTSSKIQGDQKF